MNLSTHFSLAELTTTTTGIANTTTDTVILANLKSLCDNILEKVREHYNSPVVVHSGYRCPAVNTAVGSSNSSQHTKGEAADFHVEGFTVYQVAVWIDANLDYDQLILENFIPGIETSGWVHCSFKNSQSNRNQTLTKYKGSKDYHPGIILNP